MASGLDALHALQQATANLSIDSSFALNRQDVKDLAKLRVSELEGEGFDTKLAESAVQGLNTQNPTELRKCLGINLSVAPSAPSLPVCQPH